ncbi:TPA: hypothetical protein NJ400_004436 [Vibrio parahaemolyticus]|nr:hypothetical protein [Vibrio parahaemolyticus]HCG7539226.1 hypothetical protein [Vibrio parahaemolyticus]
MESVIQQAAWEDRPVRVVTRPQPRADCRRSVFRRVPETSPLSVAKAAPPIREEIMNQNYQPQQQNGPTHTVAVRVGTRKNDPQNRGIYRTIGAGFANQDGTIVIKCDVWPLGHTEFDGTLYINPSDQQAPQSQQQGGYQQPQSGYQRR